MININGATYEIVQEHRDAINEEALKARYSDILSRYDYIVGDWGYGQLRLKGFFDDGQSHNHHLHFEHPDCRLHYKGLHVCY